MSAASFVLILPLDKIEDRARLSGVLIVHTVRTSTCLSANMFLKTLLVHIRGTKSWRSWANIQETCSQ